MAALPNSPNSVRVRLRGLAGSAVWNNVFHLQYSGTAPGVADFTTLANAIGTAWNNNINPLCHTSVSLVGVDLADLTSPTAATVSVNVSATGTRAGTALPANSAMVSSWQANVRFRGGHPRTYWPAGVSADTTSNRLWLSGFQTAAQTAVAGFRTALNALTTPGATYRMVYLSYVRNKVPLTTPVPYTINTVVIHGRIDSQRRRLGRETP